MSLDVAPIRDALGDHASRSGKFERFARYEPKSPTGTGISGAIWLQEVRPLSLVSGLAITSALVTFWLRIYQNMLLEPQDDIDPLVSDACTWLMNEYSGDFTLGGLIKNVDLLGAHGEPLSARAGYVTIGNQMDRVMTLAIPCVVNDCFVQAP